MAELFLRFLTVGGTVTAVLLPLLLGRRWLEKRYAPQTRWILWLSLAGVLLTAPLLPRRAAPVQVKVPSYVLPMERTTQAPKVSAPAGNDAEWVERPGTGDGESVPIHTGVGTVTETPQAGPVSRGVDWTELAAAVWLGIAALLLVGEGLRYGRIRRRMMKTSRPLEGEKARLRVLPGLGSPVTVGVCRPVVFLPSEETDPMALRHELTHIGRRDTWGKALLFLTCALYWFHPLVWLMARRAGRDVEAACDAQMAEGLSLTERRAYGELLLASAGEAGALPFATRFGGSKEQMKARLTQLFRPGKQSRTLVCALLLAALLLSGLVACQVAGGVLPDDWEVELLRTYEMYDEDGRRYEYYTLSDEGLDHLSVAVPKVFPVYKDTIQYDKTGEWKFGCPMTAEERAQAVRRLERYMRALFPDRVLWDTTPENNGPSMWAGVVNAKANICRIWVRTLRPIEAYKIFDSMTDEELLEHPMVKAGLEYLGITDPQVVRYYFETNGEGNGPMLYGVPVGGEGSLTDFSSGSYLIQERRADPLTRAWQRCFSSVHVTTFLDDIVGDPNVRCEDFGTPEQCGEVPGVSYRAVWEAVKGSLSVAEDAEVRAELYYSDTAQPGYFVPCYRFYVWNEATGRYERKAEARLVEKTAPEEDKPSTGEQVTVTLDPEGKIWTWG